MDLKLEYNLAQIAFQNECNRTDLPAEEKARRIHRAGERLDHAARVAARAGQIPIGCAPYGRID
jgi:hypothetical protein